MSDRTWGAQPIRTSFGPVRDQMSAQSLLQQHVPAGYGKRLVLESPDISIQDKMQFANAIDQTALRTTGDPDGAVQFRKLLPALAGAGLGYVGAALAAPILGLDPKTKNRFGIGAAALGAVVNSVPWLNKFGAEKQALVDWVVRPFGDRAVEKALDQFSEGKPFAMSQNSVANWAKRRYFKDPRNQQYTLAAIQKRLADPQYVQRLFTRLGS